MEGSDIRWVDSLPDPVAECRLGWEINAMGVCDQKAELLAMIDTLQIDIM